MIKFIFLFLILTTKINMVKSIIKCSKCKYYLPNNYDPIFSKCLYNPTKLEKIYDIITGKLIQDNSDYEYCTEARLHNYLCGEFAKFYVPKNKMN